jgi:hypothetical protein
MQNKGERSNTAIACSQYTEFNHARFLKKAQKPLLKKVELPTPESHPEYISRLSIRKQAC